MATETIQIAEFAVETATSIKDLKSNISELKKVMEGLTIGSEEYAEALTELQKNQTALKNAMHATIKDGEDEGKVLAGLSKAANGLGTSYNALVKQMADLTQEFRATEDAARRMELAKQIKNINEELKQLDAVRGIYGRNVGDYFNQIVPGLQKTTDALKLMGKQPVMSLVMLLAPVLTKIVDALKENETALGAINKLLDGLKPVMDFFSGIIEKIAGYLADVVEWVLQLAKDSGVSFNKVISGAIGVGNAIKEFLLIPIRNVIDGAKAMGTVFQDIFTGQFKKVAADAKQAVKDIGDNFKKGFDFKGNFAAGQQAGEVFVSGLKSKKVKDSARSAGKDVMAAFLESLENEVIEEEDFSNVFLWDPDGEIRSQNQQMLDDLIAQQDEFNRQMAERARIEQEAATATAQQERERLRQRREAYADFAGSVSNIFSVLADLYDSNNEADERAAQRAKQLRTASAIISSITGAIAAYMNTIESVKLPNIAIPLAALNAATVLAAGMAQVKQINAVQVGSGGTSPTPALAQAPSFSPAIPQIRSVTGQSEEARLNRMASNQRVYLVYSDLEVAQTAQRVKVAETEF